MVHNVSNDPNNDLNKDTNVNSNITTGCEYDSDDDLPITELKRKMNKMSNTKQTAEVKRQTHQNKMKKPGSDIKSNKNKVSNKRKTAALTHKKTKSSNKKHQHYSSNYETDDSDGIVGGSKQKRAKKKPIRRSTRNCKPIRPSLSNVLSDCSSVENNDGYDSDKDPKYLGDETDSSPDTSNSDYEGDNDTTAAQGFDKKQTEDQNIRRALDITAKKQRAEHFLKSFHEKRLDNICISNNVQRISIPADGNCFYSATIYQLNQNEKYSQDITSLRSAVCKVLMDRKDHYEGFYDTNSTRSYEEEVEYLKISGHWQASLASCIPEIVCTILNCSMIIYTSRIGCPLVSIEPSFGIADYELKYAFLDIKGHEHYEACAKLTSARNYVPQSRNDVPESSNDVPESRNDVPESSNDAQESRNDIPEFSNDVQESRNDVPESSNDVQKNRNDVQKTKSNVKQTGNDIEKNRSSPHTTSNVSDTPTSKNNPKVTPRKSAEFISPKKKQLARKRKRNPDSWKCNVRKRLRLEGQEYTSSMGKGIAAKKIKDGCNAKCLYKCHEKFDEPARQGIFNTYRSLPSYTLQSNFQCQNINEVSTKKYLDLDGQVVSGKKKKMARVYSFTVNTQRARVCKNFVMDTLVISNTSIKNALSQKVYGQFVGRDERGKHSPHNKTPEPIRQRIKQHIMSFPTVESHYTRKNSKREYLQPGLSIKKMFELFVEDCEQKKLPCVNEKIYRKILNDDFNISFHKPQKDQCLHCEQFKQKERDGLVAEKDKKEYESHLKLKDEARNSKKEDGQRAKDSNEIHTATFDLEAVLTTPCSLVSQAYYRRKLCSYNLSFYSLSNKRGNCYVWDETDGRRGASEIGTSLCLYLKSLPRNVKTVNLYSDSCMGQNKNQYVAALLLHSVSTSSHIEEINQKFLESGHTQMESDSIHSAVEFAKKSTSVYVPSQWDTVIAMARRRNPYQVIPLKYFDFIDSKDVAKQMFDNVKVDTTGKAISWRKLKWIQYRKAEPQSLFVKDYYNEEEFREVQIKKKERATRANAGFADQESGPATLRKLYNEKLPISEAKYRDLLALCKCGIIPAEFHGYYANMKSESSVTDTLPVEHILDEDYE